MKQFRSRLIVPILIACLTAMTHADEESAIKQIEESGGSVRRIAQSVESKEAAFHLSDKDITDEALKPLAEVSDLVWVYLQGTKITNEGVKHLSGIKSLTKLHLEKTAVGDAGVAHLAGLENLEYLNLYNTQVTDAGLEHLMSLKKLKKLYLWQSQATEAGVAKLQEALPDAEIVLGVKLAKAADPKEEEKPKEEVKKDTPKDEPAKEKEEPAKESLAAGQFVRIRLVGDSRILSLAEVQVFQTGDNAELHKAGKASQSSVDHGGGPERGNDGKTNQVYNDGSVTHTKSEKHPWWQLDLGGKKEIGRIKVWNRKDCCGDRLAQGIVEVLDEAQKVVWSKEIADAKDGSVHALVKK